MKGINIAEQLHIVNILPPHDANTVATPEVLSLSKYNHASIILQLGVTGAAMTLTVEECDDFTPTTSTAIAFNYYACTTANGDTLGARTAATSAGISTSTNNDIFYVIEIDAAELTAGFGNVRIVLSDPAAATYTSAVAILSGPRYGGSRTAIA